MLVKVMLMCLENLMYFIYLLNIVSALQYIWGYFVTIVSRVCTVCNKKIDSL